MFEAIIHVARGNGDSVVPLDKSSRKNPGEVIVPNRTMWTHLSAHCGLSLNKKCLQEALLRVLEDKSVNWDVPKSEAVRREWAEARMKIINAQAQLILRAQRRDPQPKWLFQSGLASSEKDAPSEEVYVKQEVDSCEEDEGEDGGEEDEKELDTEQSATSDDGNDGQSMSLGDSDDGDDDGNPPRRKNLLLHQSDQLLHQLPHRGQAMFVVSISWTRLHGASMCRPIFGRRSTLINWTSAMMMSTHPGLMGPGRKSQTCQPRIWTT